MSPKNPLEKPDPSLLPDAIASPNPEVATDSTTSKLGSLAVEGAKDPDAVQDNKVAAGAEYDIDGGL